MTNIIVPLVDGFDEANKLFKSFKKKDCVFYVGLTKNDEGKVKKSKFVKVFVYKNGSKKEEMINALNDEISESKIVICRKLISKEELEKFVASPDDITICEKKKPNAFVNFLHKIWQRIVHFVFDISFFDGDVSVVAFSENISQVANKIKNLSYDSRVNRWKGVYVAKIPTSTPPAKKEYNKLKNNFMLCGWVGLFLAVVASCAVFFVFVKPTFLFGLLWASLLLVSLVAMLISIMIYVINVETGNRRFEKAIKEEGK